jgi:hypothetical protein
MLFFKKTKSKPSQTSQTKMTDVIKALDLLVEYPDLQAYIKSFTGPGGYMFTVETKSQRRACQIQLEELLDAEGRHSGGSWGRMLRNVQAVLNGIITRESLLAEAADEEEHYRKMRAKNAELRRAQAEEKSIIV